MQKQIKQAATVDGAKCKRHHQSNMDIMSRTNQSINYINTGNACDNKMGNVPPCQGRHYSLRRKSQKVTWNVVSLNFRSIDSMGIFSISFCFLFLHCHCAEIASLQHCPASEGTRYAERSKQQQIHRAILCLMHQNTSVDATYTSAVPCHRQPVVEDLLSIRGVVLVGQQW